MKTADGLGGFLAEADEIKNLLKELKQDVSLVKKKEGQILSASQADGKRKELDNLMAKTKLVSKVIRAKLKDMELSIAKEELEQSAQTQGRGDQLQVKIAKHAELNRTFMAAARDYEAVQTSYLEKCKGRMKRQLSVAHYPRTPSADEEMEKLVDADEENWKAFLQGIISESAQAKQMLAEIEARHNEILQMERSIREFHDMFIEVATVVETQEEKVDRIVAQVAAAKEHVENARKETEEALKLQVRSRNKKILIIGIALIIIIGAGVALYFLVIKPTLANL